MTGHDLQSIPSPVDGGGDPGAHTLGSRARVLMGALPALQQLRSAVVVIKYGGAVMGDPDLADWWARDVVLLEHLGVRPVVVHGGGPELTRWLERLGIPTSFEDGHRVTTAETAAAAEMVLSGRLNKEVVSRLNRAGGRAFGLSGTDGDLLRVRRHAPRGRDLGMVGEVEAVDPRPLRALVDAGFIPVVSSTATGPLGETYNINADLVAGAVAAALAASRLVFLSDVAGIAAGGRLVPLLGATRARALLAQGEAQGGMRPKLEGALRAIEGGVPRVHLLDGRVRHALLIELVLEPGQGTLVVPDAHAPDAPEIEPVPPAAAPATAGTLAERGARVLMTTYSRYPIEIASGRGCRVTDRSGRSYLDFAAGIAVNLLGHAHPAVTHALGEAARGLLHTSNLYWTEPMIGLAERLTRASGMDRAFFCNSGTEAIEAAIKLARKARPGRSRLVVFERSFHGRTMGALSATIQPAYQEPFRPLVPDVVAVGFGDFDAAAAAIDGATAAVLIEPIQGEGGVRPAPAGFLAHLRKACDRSGALLLLDEVQTGLGRTGERFAFQQDGAVPDAVACAKALAGGLPMGCLLARGEAALALAPGDHGSTFGGGPFVATVANAVLDTVLAPGFLDGVRRKAERLERALGALGAAHPDLVTGIRGRGLMWGIALTGTHAPDLVALLHEAGLLTVPAGKDVLRLLPPLIVSEAEIDQAAALLDAGMTALERRLAPAPVEA